MGLGFRRDSGPRTVSSRAGRLPAGGELAMTGSYLSNLWDFGTGTLACVRNGGQDEDLLVQRQSPGARRGRSRPRREQGSRKAAAADLSVPAQGRSADRPSRSAEACHSRRRRGCPIFSGERGQVPQPGLRRRPRSSARRPTTETTSPRWDSSARCSAGAIRARSRSKGLFLKANSALIGPGEGVRARFRERRTITKWNWASSSAGKRPTSARRRHSIMSRAIRSRSTFVRGTRRRSSCCGEASRSMSTNRRGNSKRSAPGRS